MHPAGRGMHLQSSIVYHLTNRGKLEGQRHGKEMVVSDYDLVDIGGGFAGEAAALSFLETAEQTGRAGRVA
jgi:hypothetical protein